jgi:GR25 family glycosyltransferase involved in LPS biosynthesis
MLKNNTNKIILKLNLGLDDNLQEKELEKELLGLEKELEKEHLGLEKGLEKEHLGLEKGLEKELLGLGLEKELLGLELEKELENKLQFIDKIYVINLDYRTDRWEHCVEQFKKYNITNYERFSAIKYNLDITNDEFKPHVLTYNNIANIGINYIKNAYGCKKSHMSIYEKYKNIKNKNILILEDDFFFVDNFLNKFNNIINDFINSELVQDYKIFYLGFTFFKNRSTCLAYKKNANIFKIKKCYGGYGYIVNSNFCNELLNICNTKKFELDNCLAYSQSIYKIYASNPSLIGHNNTFSDICNKFVEYKKIFIL